MRSHKIKAGILKATTFPPCLLTWKSQSCTKSLLYPRYRGLQKKWCLCSPESILAAATPRYCSDPTGLHYLERHISTGCGSHSTSKSGVTSLYSPIRSLLPGPHTARIACSVTSRCQLSCGQKPRPSYLWSYCWITLFTPYSLHIFIKNLFSPQEVPVPLNNLLSSTILHICLNKWTSVRDIGQASTYLLHPSNLYVKT